ncbi:MAG: hypothetical protein WC556_12795 [Candidatus Methanoperedens sp.]
MSKSKRKNKLRCEGQNIDFYTDKNEKGGLYIGFDAAKGKHITIIHENDGISVHLTNPNESDPKDKHQRMLKISPEEARQKLSFEGLKIVNVEPSWELWSPKENIVSITYELTNQGKLPKTFIDAGKNHFDSLVSLAIKNGVLDVLFERITYQQLLNGEYVLAYKVDVNGIATSILAISTTLAVEIPLFSKETEDLLNKILCMKTLMPE